ncbi:ribonuclease G [Thiomonas bhubaneswarensis]|uniref:Ribonuclease G n=1 Tax=Thiomonas bhubaneswarensis TaxID=339866 RepID=A0A0K6HQH4_9BURK|nr:ribonuclease G [Thiomonas bhubaneswarensis]CUA93063.1 ribonuclease, Rne/Rng family [Thiomonas bhubaneswarensis]
MNPTPEDILINITPQETRVALVAHAAVQELHIERSLERGLVGNVYLGRVVRVLPGMQSAFIEIGLERTAFLHVADLWQRQSIPVNADASAEAPAAPAAQPIEKLLYEGQTLMVQVLKDPINTKGARLTTQISLAGRMLVHLPQDDHIGISQKIDGAEQRAALRERMSALLAAEDGGSQGFIVRTNAEDASDAELAEDIAYLRKTWRAIQQRAHDAAPSTLVYQELSLAQRVLRDLVSDATRSVQIDSRENFELLQAFAAEYMPRVSDRLQLYRGERPLFETANVDEEIERALGRRVDLKSGGYLIIDQTEAMTTIDVNTGGFVGARNFDDTIYRTNLEATQAIARQLRLRNLGGIIIIDFIDMHNAQHRAAVLDELRKSLARDKVKVTVSGFSQLGLVELTRKRTRDSLAHMLLEPCPTCGGLGQVKTARTVCYEILREILREAKQFNPREFRIVGAADVIDLFLEEESQHLASLSDFIGKPVSLQVEPAFSQQQYDIVLT